MKVLVTGAAGFIGGRLASRLLSDGLDGQDVEVIGLDSFTDHYDQTIKRHVSSRLSEHRCFTLVESDLNHGNWQHVLDDVEVVFHQAGQPGVRGSWANGFDAHVRQNVSATQRLLEACARRPLRRFVFASSSSVYGNATAYPTSEDSLAQPLSPYGVTKLAAEQLCRAYALNCDLPAVALRYFTVYGSGQRPDMAISRMIAAAQGRRPFPRFGDGEQVRDLTHVDDVVTANLAAVECEVTPGTVINVAGGARVTVNELLELVGTTVGRSVPIDDQPAQPGDLRRTHADTSRAHQLMGWQAVTDLTSGIAEQVSGGVSKQR